MVSIKGLPPPGISGTGKSSKTSKAGKKQGAGKPKSAVDSARQPTPVAHAVSHSLEAIKNAESYQNNLQYDLPEGRARKALEEYFDVMNQTRREELAQMMGVDIYI
uniref:Chromosome segregation ATPase n=1 Tax=Vibrio aerogenes TaxID=92172 RepID=G8FTA5_9VIBR|nr:chromosome segregation ATPase [Vibrio aerogenes CECT 7868]